jgi:murein DD-endopeptidase MepM/ murein hydrolase activator NlpD
VLERNLALHQERLAKLTELFRIQTKRLVFLRRQYDIALTRLNGRLVSIYESDDPDTLAVVLSASSFSDLLDELDYLNQIGSQDKRIAHEVAAAKADVRRVRERTRRTRAGVATETHLISVRTGEQRAVRDRLLASQRELTSARAEKRQALSATQESEQEYLNEVNGLQAASSRLAARIQAAEAAAPKTSLSSGSSAPADSTPSSSGLIWPVSGPITSPFGMRWGRMHEGIDIGAATGTPIHAAASGTVIYAGWESGYGNLVVIDHGGGLATAYGHQSAIATSNGASVSQGQVIGYVGCTGHCFGPHLHFEVRVNGQPVDPLRYL